MKNKLASSHKLIFDKIVNRTHSHTALSKYVINTMLDSYSYECILLGYEPAGLTVHPPPQNDRGWVNFFRMGV